MKVQLARSMDFNLVDHLALINMKMAWKTFSLFTYPSVTFFSLLLLWELSFVNFTGCIWFFTAWSGAWKASKASFEGVWTLGMN
jgi:hypothetical protein